MLLTVEGAVLLLIDLQERLMPVIGDHEAVVARAVRLAEAAALLEVSARPSRTRLAWAGQCRRSPLTRRQSWPRTTFSAAGDPGFPALLPAGSGEIVVAGCEAHVCVLQAVLDLLAAGRRVIWAADATGSRDPADRAAAIDRARQHGAEIVTSEMVLFEWLRDARHPSFKRVHALLTSGNR